MQGPPVFMDLALEDQVQELRIYLKDLGAEITIEKSPKGIEDDLHKIIGVCDACFKEGSESEVEKVLNDIVSIMVVIPLERAENIILAFCEKLTKAPHNRGMVTLRALLLLYQSLHDRSPMRYHVYYALVQIAQTTDQVRAIFRNIDILKSQFIKCPPSIEQLQKLYRLLHEVLLKSRQSEQAAKVMYELLNTYTSENASHARDDAIKCIVTALADPQTFLLDPLLSLKPVRFLEGELIHDLLSIFVSEKLTSYLSFYEKHSNFVTSLLSHEANLKKMRILTFMQMAEQSAELTFDDIERELQIGNDEVESLIVEILKTGLVRCRVDQAGKKVFVGSTMHRTFGRAQWSELRELLWQWKLQMGSVQQGMKSVAEAQIELMKH